MATQLNKDAVIVNFRPTQTYTKLPIKSTIGAACYDAYLPDSFPPLMPGDCRIINLGFQVEVPYGFELQVRSRSGLASKGIIVANGIGCIDSDYRGDVGVILLNLSGAIQPLNQGDRICQLKLAYAPDISWNIVDTLDFTERGSGGFGSTGVSDV